MTMLLRLSGFVALSAVYPVGCSADATTSDAQEAETSDLDPPPACAEFPPELLAPSVGFLHNVCLGPATSFGTDGCGPVELGGEWRCVLAALRDGLPGRVEIRGAWNLAAPEDDPTHCGENRTYLVGRDRQTFLTVDPLDYDQKSTTEVTLRPPEFFDACLSGDETAIRACLWDVHDSDAGLRPLCCDSEGGGC